MKLSKLALAVAAGTSVFLNPAYVQAAGETIEEVIVTGTSRARSEFDTPVAVSAFDESDLRKLSVSSQADILRTVPGLKAEGGGGEVAANVFVSGLPSGGQYAFTPLQYDGFPVFSTFGLNSSAFDVYARNDLGIERLEFVSGGASNLFGAGSVSGLINYISKTGTDDPQSTIQFEVAEEGRMRADFATSGPLVAGSNNYYALSGFYRYDEGPLKTGLPSEGYQLRGNLKHEFADGSGHFTVYGQLIDDSVQFFLPYPLNADRSRATGNDGSEILTVQTEEAEGLTYLTPDGKYTTDIRDGVLAQGGMIAFDFTKDVINDWTLNAKTSYKRYTHQFNFFLDGDGITNQPLSLEDYLDQNGFGTVGVADLPNASYTFTNNGQPVPDDYILFGNRVLDRDRPATDFTAEVSATKTFDFSGLSHAVTIGAYASRAEAGDLDHIITYLGELNDQPRLIDLSVTDVDGSLTGTPGNVLVVSRKGMVRSNGQTSDADHRAIRTAMYITDQIEAENWSLDFGARVERMEGNINRESGVEVPINEADLAAFMNLQPGEVLTSNLSNVTIGSGTYARGDVDDTAVAVSGAFLYRLNDTVNVYVNGSRGFFFPQLRSHPINALGEPGPYDEEEIIQGELGLKYDGEKIGGSTALFYTELNDRQSIQFINDGMGGVITTSNTTSTEAKGIKLAGNWFVTDALSVNLNLTYQDAEYTKFEGVPANVGTDLQRNPDFLATVGVSYSTERFDISLSDNYTAKHYVADGNKNEVDAFDIVNLNAGYTMPMGSDDETLRLGLSVFNLFDSDGITEGSPRQGSAQTASTYFIGRPVLPRRVTLRLTYDF